MAPISWRDVYTLLESHDEKSEKAHGELSRRIRVLEDDKLARESSRKEQKRVFGIARETLAVIISVGAFVFSFFFK